MGGSQSAFFVPERDPIDGASMQAVRNFILFRLDNFQPGLAIELAITNSFTSQHDFRLANVILHGAQSQALGFIGRGSGVLRTTAPIKPLVVDGRQYILFEFIGRPLKFPVAEQLINWNANVHIDPRPVTSFVRSIKLSRDLDAGGSFSWVNLGDLQFWRPQGGKLLTEYSGIFESGWMSDKGIVRLKSNDDSTTLVVHGHFNERFVADLSVKCGDNAFILEHAVGDLRKRFMLKNSVKRCDLIFSAIAPRGAVNREVNLFYPTLLRLE